MNIDVNNDSNNGAEIKRFHVGESNDDIIVSDFPSNQLNLTLKDPKALLKFLKAVLK